MSTGSEQGRAAEELKPPQKKWLQSSPCFSHSSLASNPPPAPPIKQVNSSIKITVINAAFPPYGLLRLIGCKQKWDGVNVLQPCSVVSTLLHAEIIELTYSLQCFLSPSPFCKDFLVGVWYVEVPNSWPSYGITLSTAYGRIRSHLF